MQLVLQEIVDRGGPWERAEVIGNALLLQGDCLLCLPHLPKVDAVITDDIDAQNKKRLTKPLTLRLMFCMTQC